MGRHAYGDELSCGGTTGGCRNLAVWLIRPRHGRPWMVCGLHLDAKLRLLQGRWETSSGLFTPEVEPFQDPAAPIQRKRKRARLDR